MVSVNTSFTGMATAALRSINAQLATTQNRIATGYKINSAADSASVWATASAIRSDKSASEALKGGALAAKAQADSGLAALDEASKLFQAAREVTVAANGAASAADVAKVNALVSQAVAIIGGAGVGGKNVLTTDSLSAVVNINGGTATSLTMANENILGQTSSAYSTAIYKDLLKAQADTDLNDRTKTIAYIDAVQTAIGTLSAKLGAFSSGVESTMSFLDKLNDIRESAIGGLVDADLEKESAKLNALQVKQQLAYQAISIGNSSAQNILRLFQ